MTPEQRTEINKQNAQHSTGPKTPEGKAKSAQNAVTHGLTSLKPPLENPHFLKFLRAFQEEHNPQSPTANALVLEIAHVAFKLEQFPQLEYEVELNSGLTLAEHFMQDKPTPLVKLWNLQLRLGGRFNTLDRKLRSLNAANASLAEYPSAPKPPLQNKPTVCHCSASSEKAIPADNPPVQNEPTPPASSLQFPASPLQNKPTTPSTARAKLAFAVNSVPIPL